ncbi:thioredoxin family protein [Demequina globuliformis]|uniref:thioredoxin family protein n=1 Tax=Demequina globuliformis TaxID=676202 RepID=UPI0007834EC2|nr:thioredoxin family protein [Demequina globuliformis]
MTQAPSPTPVRTRTSRVGAFAAGLLIALLVLATAGANLITALTDGAARAAEGQPGTEVIQASALDTPVITADAPVTVDPDADLVLFWGDGCPNCEKERAWLESVERDYPDLTIAQYEVWGDDANRELFASEAERLGFEAGSVPTTIIDERVWIGWTDAIEQDMAGAISMVERGETPTPGIYGTAGAGTCAEDGEVCSAEAPQTVIDVPLFGEVTVSADSLLMSTIVIGFVDGINPCSLWVLSVLLTIVLRTNSRRRVLAIGTTFLTVTAIMYALYMAAFYSALAVVGMLGWIQVVVAAVAGIFGIVSVKDYFAMGKGLSFTIRKEDKPGIYSKMRAAAGKKALIPALGATVVLAIGVSLLETPCTAGFPVLWTGMLHANGVGPTETAGLFVAYMVPFLLDELIIFGIAVATMKATKMQDKHGELLKLFAGVTMLVLAAVMVIDPTLMENPWAALGLFAGAFAVALVIHLVTVRVVAARQPVDAPRPPDDGSPPASAEVSSGAADGDRAGE